MNFMKFTPLHYACITGHTSIVKVLLKHQNKFDIKIQTNEGNTPLHCAVISGNFGIIKRLVQAFAQEISIDARNNSGQSPLDIAREMNLSVIANFLYNFYYEQNYIQTYL